jgi:hypothetical protein
MGDFVGILTVSTLGGETGDLVGAIMGAANGALVGALTGAFVGAMAGALVICTGYFVGTRTAVATGGDTGDLEEETDGATMGPLKAVMGASVRALAGARVIAWATGGEIGRKDVAVTGNRTGVAVGEAVGGTLVRDTMGGLTGASTSNDGAESLVSGATVGLAMVLFEQRIACRWSVQPDTNPNGDVGTERVWP